MIKKLTYKGMPDQGAILSHLRDDNYFLHVCSQVSDSCLNFQCSTIEEAETEWIRQRFLEARAAEVFTLWDGRIESVRTYRVTIPLVK